MYVRAGLYDRCMVYNFGIMLTFQNPPYHPKKIGQLRQSLPSCNIANQSAYNIGSLPFWSRTADIQYLKDQLRT